MLFTASDAAQAACRDALAVQDACNLSGVIHSMARHIDAIRAAGDCPSTDLLNNHPAMILFADKIGHLTRHQNFDNLTRLSAAQAACELIADGNSAEFDTGPANA